MSRFEGEKPPYVYGVSCMCCGWIHDIATTDCGPTTGVFEGILTRPVTSTPDPETKP